MSELNRLTKYLEHIKSRISDGIPPKHEHRPKAYMRYLENEKKDTEAKIEALRLEGGKK